jgi:hypothetical protein
MLLNKCRQPWFGCTPLGIQIETVQPFGEPLRNLLELRVARLAAPAAMWIVEQRLAHLPALLNVFEKALSDHMAINRHRAPLLGLLEARFNDHAPDAGSFVLDDISRIERSEFVHAGARVGAEPRQPAPGRAHLDGDQMRRLRESCRQDRLGLVE